MSELNKRVIKLLLILRWVNQGSLKSYCQDIALLLLQVQTRQNYQINFIIFSNTHLQQNTQKLQNRSNSYLKRVKLTQTPLIDIITMSQSKKQPQIRITSVKDAKSRVVYFKKQFKLMIHNITLEQQIRSTIFSLQSANYTSIPQAVFHITINSTVDITTIDMTSNEEERADLEVTLDLSHFAKGIKNDLAIVKFQVAKEKILAPASVNFYTQPLANRKGTIEYKFVAQKITQIDQQEFLKHNIRRDEIIQIEKQLAQNPQLKRLVQILDAKDQVIKTLEKKIASLIEQTRKLTHNLQRQTSEQRKRLRQGLNLNLNVNASNNYHMKRLNEKLSQENGYLQKRLEAVEQQLETTQKQLIQYRCENNILQIEIGKKSMIDGPTINLNPSKSVIEQNRHILHKIQEQEYDQELQRKSKMADSFFLPGEESSVRSKVPTGRRANQTMTMNASNIQGLTPRGNSKGRTKSVIDPSIVNTFQQQLNQSKVMDQEQVQLQLNELKDLRQNMENKLLQAVPQQDGMLRYPRLQAAIKSSYRVMQRLNEQKNLLEQKLKRRQQEIQYLRRQLQKSKQNFKNFEKELRQRSSNAKDQFEQRMAAIKLQTQMKMAQMRRQNRFSDYESVMQTEKRQIEVQKMRYENDALREKYQEAMNELRNLQLEKASEQNKYKTVQAAINKQKEMYKSKYYEMQDSFTKQEQELEVTKDKAKMYELHVGRIEELEKVEQTLKGKIEKDEKQIHEQRNKIKRYEDKFTEIEPKWQFYRQMQHEFQLVKKKNQTITKLNDRFESRMQELKKFASRLQTAYYQKRQRNQSQLQFDDHYKKQLEQRLEATFKKLRTYQREFYEEQMKELTETKKQLIEFYYKRIVEESQRIDENPTYTQADKQKFKNEKQHDINIVKEAKLDQLEKQYKKYESAFGKLVSTEEYLPKGLHQKISYLQQKLRKFQVGEFGTGVLSNASQSIMKNTLDRLTDSVKDRQSQITELKRTIGKMSDGSSLLKVNNVEIANQRKSMIEEMQKSREIFTKSLEDLKRANQELLKQKSQLQIEVQNYRFRQQKLIFKNTERQKQLQRVSKKNTDEYKKKITELQKALEKKNDQNLKNKILKEQFEQHTKQLVSQVNNNSSLLEKLQSDLKNLEEQNQQLRTRLQLYHQAEKMILQQVDQIKKQADFDLKSFKALLEQRNAEFDKIKHIKDVEIDKLNKTIQEYEFRIQTQVNEYLHTRRDLEQLQDKCEGLEAQLQETKVSFNVVNQNYHKVEEDSVLKIHELEEANLMLQTTLMEMAEGLKEKEMELHEAKIKQQSLEKQLLAISAIRQQLTQQQAQFSVKQKHYQQLIEQLTDKLSTLQNKYIEISDKVHQVQRQNEFVNCKLIEKDSQVEELRDKLNKKYDQINQLKSVKFDVQMKVKQLNMQFEDNQKTQQKDQEYIAQIQDELEELKNHVQVLQAELQQQNIQKSRLKAPPKTNLMSGSAISDHDLSATKMNKSTRQNNLIKKTSILSKKQMREIQQSQRTNLEIQQAQSIRGTNLNTPIDLNFQQNGPNRFRIWTVNQSCEDMRSPSHKNRVQASKINVDLSQDSNEDANLQSDMSAREQQLLKSNKVFKTMVKQQKSDEESIVIDQNIHQVQSYGSSQMVEQYLREIDGLRDELDRIMEEKRVLEEENGGLRDRIGQLTGNVEESQRKNLLASALGLTGGLFMRQQGQRSSVESNYENPNIPKIKLKSGSNITPAITSKQAIKIQDNNKSIHGSIQGSRKSSIHSPGRRLSPRQRSQQSKLPGSNANLARSSVGEIGSTRKQSLEQHIEQQNQRVKQLQLMLHEVEQQNKQLKAALDDEHSAVEQLMEEIQVVQQVEEDNHRLVEEKAKEVQQLTEYYEGVRVQMEKRVEKLVEEGMERESEEIKLLKTFEAKNEEIQTLVNKIERLERELSVRSGDISKLIKEKERSYKEFRKYEQESQLQILRLKEQMTHLTELTQKKHSQVQLLAEDYFEMNNELNQLKQAIKQKDLQIMKQEQKIEQLTKSYNQIIEQTKKTQQAKRTLRLRIHQLQNDLVAYQSNMMDVNKATSLTIKKHEIKLNTSEQEKLLLKEKLHQRQTTIQSLKHTIALYNDQTDQLKHINKDLTLQLERTQSQLKDIMKSYQTQFREVNLNLQASEDNTNKVKALVSQKDQQIHQLTKAINLLQGDTRTALNSQLQLKQTFDKYKSAKQNEISHLSAQLQLKNDQYQKIKSHYQKQTKQFIGKQQQYVKKLQLSEQSKKTYKQKLVKYQTVLQELSTELELMSTRPTKQQFDQLQFENQLYKNRIEQLEQMLRDFAPQTNNNKHSPIHQSLQLEFKKYKVQKQRQLDDLSSEIEKYCLKINELEENNFMLKKQLEKLRQQMHAVLEQGDAIKQENYDLKEDLTELKEEIQFYKGKRIQNLSKLLNETM